MLISPFLMSKVLTKVTEPIMIKSISTKTNLKSLRMTQYVVATLLIKYFLTEKKGREPNWTETLLSKNVYADFLALLFPGKAQA